MSKATLTVGSYIEYDGDKLHLIRKFDGDIWQVECEKTKRIKEFSEGEILSLMVNEQLKLYQRYPDTKKGISAKKILLSTCDLGFEKAVMRRDYVIATLHLPNTKSILLPVIEETWKKLGCKGNPPHPSTVIAWKNKYENDGENPLALLDRHMDKGNRIGRYCSEVEKFVMQAVHRTYLRRERGSIKDVLDCAKYYINEENHLRGELNQLVQPTLALVKRLVKSIHPYDATVARYGREHARNKFRTVVQNRLTSTPLERVEIDHTLLDLFVYDEESGTPYGRPWLTVCIDDYTRCVLGFSISFDDPSDVTVHRCLKQAFLPKIELLKNYPSIKNDWPAHGVMTQLVVDNGFDFHSKTLRNTCLTLGIEIHRAPRKTGWFKGKVERFFGTVNSGYTHITPGTSFSNIFEKGDYNPGKFTVKTYKELHEDLYKWLVDVYHQDFHSGINTSPDNMWKNSISQKDISLVSSPEDLYINLGTPTTRVLSHKGIQLGTLFYNSAEMNDLRYRYGDTCDVNVLYDKGDLGAIVVFVKGDGHHYIVPALRQKYANGLTSWMHKENKKWLKGNNLPINEKSLLQAKAEVLKWADSGKKSAKKARVIGHKRLLSGAKVEPDKTAKTNLLDDTKHIDEDEVVVVDTSMPVKYIKPIHRPRGSNSLTLKKGDS